MGDTPTLGLTSQQNDQKIIKLSLYEISYYPLTFLFYATIAMNLITFRTGAADFIVAEAWVFKLHLVLGMSLFIIFPFTRLVHIWSVPVQYLTRSNYQIVRRRG
jgi:respiratory nitrate reductase gamma subunit